MGETHSGEEWCITHRKWHRLSRRCPNENHAANAETPRPSHPRDYQSLPDSPLWGLYHLYHHFRVFVTLTGLAGVLRRPMHVMYEPPSRTPL